MTIDAVHRPASSTAAQASAQAAPARPAGKIETKPGPLVQFEAFFLQSFIQSIMPQDATAVYGEGTAGDVWKSMMAEKIALQVAEAGGVGIAKMIAPKTNVVADPSATAAPGMTSPTADRLLEMQSRSAPGSEAAAATAMNSWMSAVPGRGAGEK